MIDVEEFYNKHKDNKLWNKNTIPNFNNGIIYFYDNKPEDPLSHEPVLSFNITGHKNQNEKYWLNHIKIQLTLFSLNIPRDMIPGMYNKGI